MNFSIKKIGISLCALIGSVAMVGSSAVSVARDTIDLSIGPVAVNSQAVNIALALSVEYPTVGAAYRKPDYDHATKYLGYFDTKACYVYQDIKVGAPLNGNYFYRTGSTDASGYCNSGGSGTGYAGNVLNYVSMTPIDLVRYTITGGNRVVDTTDTTIIERAYLRNSNGVHHGDFKAKRIAAALTGKVTPDVFANDIYGGSCWDRIMFGSTNAGQACDNPGLADDYNPSVPDPTSTSTKSINAGTVVTTPTWVLQASNVYQISNPLVTSTTAPSAGPITTSTLVVVGAGTSTTAPPSGYETSLFYTTSYVATAGTTSVTPTAGPLVPVGNTTATMSPIRFLDTIQPTSGLYNTRTLKKDSGVQVCALSGSGTAVNFRGKISGAVGNNDCTNGIYGAAYNTRVKISSISSGRAADFLVYEPYRTLTTYKVHTATPVYKAFTLQTVYDQYVLKDLYTVFGSKQGILYARVRVCDDSEKTTRTDLCQRYPAGNYKSVGEVQRNAQGVRLASFGYLNDDTAARYGGVLRAPMKYTGPTYRDPDGVVQTNASSEWDASTGIFNTDPLGASPTFTQSGVINYLNKFGTTGSTKGQYKTIDPVGELYYEVLRYFQGLDPTADATTGLPATGTSTLADGFPVYTQTSVGAKWQDPIQNACERRNYAMVIGDVNTHRDRYLPGLPATMVTTDDPLPRAAEPLKGDASKTFDAVQWTNVLTGFETNSSITYIDAAGKTQYTLGNPNPNTNNTNLATKNGGCCSGAYFWAGAAYWANTQPIRLDNDSKGQSLKDVRIKTFTIDVDEGGNGDIEDTNTRGIKPRRSTFYLAGKYGWFNDSNFDGNPFKESGGTTSNREWEDLEAKNTPAGYVIASQAQKLVDGIRKFFSAATNQRGAVSVSSLSSQRYSSSSPNGDLFAPRFNTSEWSGSIQKTQLVLNTETKSIDALSDISWDSSEILTYASINPSATLSDPYVKPAQRKIFTMTRNGATPGGVEFKVANKTLLDPAVQTALNTNPKDNTTDNKIEERMNWLRGDRSNEISGLSGFLRTRGQIMGDIINSGPVYKSFTNTSRSGAGYSDFSETVNDREPTVYVGTNGGMLHGFRASDGKEQFAYIPRAVSENLHKLTNPAYVHQPYVDAVPVVDEVKVNGNWQTVVASGMGGGAQGVFALNVSDPSAFSADKVLFEFTDQDDSDMGNIASAPLFVQMVTPAVGGVAASAKWYLAVSSGYNNYKTDSYVASSGGDQALFLLSMDKQHGQAWVKDSNYFKIMTPASLPTVANGLGNPGAVVNRQGFTTALFAGDLQGNLWKFDFSLGLNATLADLANKVSGTAKPIFVAQNGTTRQPITISPIVYPGPVKGYMVVFGTGKFLEPKDTTNASVQAMYGLWDSLESTTSLYTIPNEKVYQRTSAESGSNVVISTTSFTIGKNTGEYRGWYFNLPATRERIAVEGIGTTGLVAFNSTIPDGSCSGDGAGTRYSISPQTGKPVGDIVRETNSGLLSAPNVIEIDLGEVNYANNSGQSYKRIQRQIISTTTKISDGGNVNVVSSSSGGNGSSSGGGNDGNNNINTNNGSSGSLPPIDYLQGIISWREVRNPKIN